MPEAVTVTVLFTDLVGSTELASRVGSDAADEIRRSHFALLETAASRGTVVKNLGDGLMVVYRSASDAVDGAVAMQRAVERNNRRSAATLGLRVGMSTGDATFESDDWFGAPVVEASRLCQLAEGGEILVSALVRAMAGTRGGFTFVDIGAQKLKGIPDEVPCCRVAWQDAAGDQLDEPVALASRRGKFVGRQDELARLESLVRTGDGLTLALLAGEPGIGKTRLAAELAALVHGDGWNVLYGRCDEEALLPYQPIVEALRAYVDQAAPAELRAQLGRDGGELARLVPEIRDRVPELAAPARADPESGRFLLFESIAAVLSELSCARPLLLVLDDLHWADKPTLLLLRHLLRSTRPGRSLLLGTYRETELSRTHPLAEALADLRREQPFERLHLRGIDARAIESLLIDAGSAPALAETLERTTEGNPFFVEQILGHLSATGELVEIPEGVKEAVGRRLSNLSAFANRVLTVAAVAGRDFDAEVVRDAGEFGEGELLAALADSVASGVVAEVAGAVDRFTFTHALIRQTLYEELTTSARVRLHRRAGDATERHYAASIDDHLGELAYHFGEAAGFGEGKAVDYALRAGRRAARVLAFEEAIEHYERALQALALAPDEDRRCELLLALAGACMFAGETDRSRTTYMEARDIARREGLTDRLASAALEFGGLGVAREVDIVQIRLLEEALHEMDDADSSVRSRLLGRLAGALQFTDEFARRDELSAESVAIARRIGNDATLVYALNQRHAATWTASNVEERLALGGEIVHIGDRIGRPDRSYWGHLWRVNALLELGDIAAVRAEADVLTTQAEALRLPIYRWQAISVRSTLALLAGRIDESQALSEEAFAVGSRGNPNAETYLWSQRFAIAAVRGIAEPVDVPALGGLGNFFLLEMHRQLGRPREVRAVLDAILASGWLSGGVRFAWLANMCVLAEAWAFVGDAQSAGEVYGELKPNAGRCAVGGWVVTCEGPVSRYLGLLAEAIGRPDDAERHFLDALEECERAEAPCYLAFTRRDYGRMLRRAGDPRADALLRDARDAGVELGMHGVVREVDELYA